MTLALSIYERLREVERRIAADDWRGPVKEVNEDRQEIRIVLGTDEDGEEVLGPWMPVDQPAGALKIKSLPSVGQIMRMNPSGGDLEQATASPYNWTDENQPPNKESGAHEATFAGWSIKLTSGALTISKGGFSWSFTPGGVRAEGGTLVHDNLQFGSAHEHRDVKAGTENTGPPNP